MFFCNANLAENALVAVNFFVETNRMEPFVAVYYITFKGWNEVNIGIISLVMNMLMIFIQTPVGDFLDKTHHKKIITSSTIVVASVTTACVVWTSNFWIVLIAKSIEGIAATFFLPALMSLLFGICSTKEDVPRFIAVCEVSNKVGSALFTLFCGLIAYFLFPDISSMFYLLGTSGLVAAACVLMIPSSSIDHDRARQLESKKISEDTSKDDTTRPEAVSYRSLLSDRSVLFFAIVTFIYHLANAAIVPLVAQYISIGDERSSMVFTSAVLLLFYFAQAITAKIMMSAVKKLTAKSLIVCAHLVLPLRCAILATIIQWWDNKYALCATQLLDGVGAGIYDTMIPIVVGRITEGTGRFGFTYGFIVTCWRMGHGLSYLLGESIVHLASYQVAFLTHSAIGILSLVVLICGVHIPCESEYKTTLDVSVTPGSVHTDPGHIHLTQSSLVQEEQA